MYHTGVNFRHCGRVRVIVVIGNPSLVRGSCVKLEIFLECVSLSGAGEAAHDLATMIRVAPSMAVF